jgi:hypothetical protein
MLPSRNGRRRGARTLSIWYQFSGGACTRTGSAENVVRATVPARLYLRETLLQPLAQDFEDMPPELRAFVQEEHAVVRQRHLALPEEVPAADLPRFRDRVRQGATRAGTVTSEVRALCGR